MRATKRSRKRRKIFKAQLLLHRGLRKIFSAIAALDHLEPLDRERLQHHRDIIEHACASILFDVAEAAQARELAEASRLDAKLFAWEQRRTAEDSQPKP